MKTKEQIKAEIEHHEVEIERLYQEFLGNHKRETVVHHVKIDGVTKTVKKVENIGIQKWKQKIVRIFYVEEE